MNRSLNVPRRKKGEKPFLCNLINFRFSAVRLYTGFYSKLVPLRHFLFFFFFLDDLKMRFGTINSLFYVQIELTFRTKRLFDWNKQLLETKMACSDNIYLKLDSLFKHLSQNASAYLTQP